MSDELNEFAWLGWLDVGDWLDELDEDDDEGGEGNGEDKLELHDKLYEPSIKLTSL